MSKSAITINYETRPCKFVERRMLLASLSRILGTIRKEKDYQYIGFGGCSFTDFKLFHRELHINKMISIEEEKGYSNEKLELNKPFQCVKIIKGKSNIVLPLIDLSLPSVIWLDYDGVLEKYMFEDLEIIFHTLPVGSIYIFSCNRELKKCNYKELEDQITSKEDGNNPMSPDELKCVFGDLAPFDIDSDACTPEKSYYTIKRMLDKKIGNVITERNLSKDENTRFQLLYNLIYQETRGAKMYTYGGIVCDDSLNIDSLYIDDFDFVVKNSYNYAYKIDVPILTHREALALNQVLFDEKKEKELIDAGIITQSELDKYKKIYKYCPSFHDVRF